MPSEEEASSQGAFDPVTGKINWDCPCLGGMAYGPCGMQFREAFSCFVFSEQEPKGIDCVEKFKAMQDCFRENPDVYGEGKYSTLSSVSWPTLLPLFQTEIMNDDEDEDEELPAPSSTGGDAVLASTARSSTEHSPAQVPSNAA
jgi:mitochondrial intermembrane space import and assembly protein 40